MVTCLMWKEYLLPLNSILGIYKILHACHSCFSDELLFEENVSNVSSISSGVTSVMHLNHGSDTAILMGGIGRFNRSFNPTHTDSRCISTGKRYIAYSFTELHTGFLG